MGLLDKLKNVFFEEEEVEVEEKPKKPKKEKPLVKKVEVPKKEEKKKEKIEKLEETVEEESIVEELEEEDDLLNRDSDKDFKFPVILDEEEPEESLVEDFGYQEEVYEEEEKENNIYGGSSVDRLEVNYESDYHQEPYSNSYTRDFNSSSYSLMDRKEVKAFKPSPVISPVYGVLDKNYKSDEIKEKNKAERKDPPVFSFSSTKLDLDTVREKAYGKPEEVYEEDVQEIEEDVEHVSNHDETLDMTDTNMKPTVDSVTVGDAEEYFEDLGLEYNVA